MLTGVDLMARSARKVAGRRGAGACAYGSVALLASLVDEGRDGVDGDAGGASDADSFELAGADELVERRVPYRVASCSCGHGEQDWCDLRVPRARSVLSVRCVARVSVFVGVVMVSISARESRYATRCFDNSGPRR